MRRSGKALFQRLSELYLWLAFVFSLALLDRIANGLAQFLGQDSLSIYEALGVVHLLSVVIALWLLRAWTSHPARLAAGLLIVGAVVFWIGASAFPGLSVERIAANLEAHFLTSGTFLLAALLTLPGLALLTVALRGTRGHVLSVMGFVGFFFASVLWTIHLAFRLTVLVWAADQPSAADGGPAWLAPWVDWAGLLFGLYSVLAFLSIAAYGGALLKAAWVQRWMGWTAVGLALAGAPLVGPPLFIHVVPWFLGIVLLRYGRADSEVL